MKKEKSKKIKENPQFTREELLGFGSEAFSLNQAEYVSKKIIDQILFHVFETIRIHNVKQMNFDYSGFRTFINLQNIVNLGLIKPEKEIEIIDQHSFDFDVNPCKIDAWASGHAKIITSTQPKEQLVPPPKSEKNEQSSKIKKKEKDKSENTLTRARRRGDDSKKAAKEPPPKELPMDFITAIEEEKKEVTSFNFDEMKLKGYRAYFQEKQIEMQKRKQLEKEQAERAKEEEKKLKQIKDLMATGKLVSWDANGVFLPLKIMKDTDLKNIPQPRQKIVYTKNIYDQDGIFDLDEEGNPKKKKIMEIYKDKAPSIQKVENYYQPNPLVSHIIPQGVTLEFYGHKKTGGKYEVDGGRLTMEQYQKLLEQIKPYSRANIEERFDESFENEEKENEGKVDENGEEIPKEKKVERTQVKKTKTMNAKSKKLYYLFRDEIAKAEEEQLKKKKNQENIIKKKKKKEEKKEKILKDKIELRDFNFKEIKNTQDKSIYRELKEKVDEGYSEYYSEQKNISRAPLELHTRDEKKIRTREKRATQLEARNTYNENLPNTIKRALTKIKEENEENEKNKKLLLPVIKNRPKSNYIFNKNNTKKVENQKNKK